MKNFLTAVRHIIVIVLILSTLFSCANERQDRNAYSAKTAPASKKEAVIAESISFDADKDTSPNLDGINLQNRQLIKTADYRIQVKNVDASTENVQQLTQRLGGIISNMNLTSDSYQIQNNITILIPNQHFETLLQDIAQDATFINHKRINTTDVTEEFVDLEARLATKKRVRDRYTDLLRNKANTIDEIFTSEEKIRVLQEEIEAKEGRLHYLQEKVTNSVVQLAIYETVREADAPKTYQASIASKFKRNLYNGWEIILHFFLAIANIWPLFIIALGVFFFRKNIICKIRN